MNTQTLFRDLITLLGEPGLLRKREFLSRTRSAAEVATMRIIKLAPDPRRILNRNRNRIFEA